MGAELIYEFFEQANAFSEAVIISLYQDVFAEIVEIINIDNKAVIE